MKCLGCDDEARPKITRGSSPLLEAHHDAAQKGQTANLILNGVRG